MFIEETILTAALPVNSRAMIARLEELLAEHGTNSLLDCKHDHRIRAVVWLINSQVFGQTAKIDMHEQWRGLSTAFACCPTPIPGQG